MEYTIKEIAQRAGVSKSTVSRVISGKGYTSMEVRDKVLQIIKELQYRPNAVARAMVLQRTNNIGVLIYREHHPIAAHPFYGKILDAILTSASGLNYSVFVTTDHEISLRSADFMFEKRVDGLILISRLQQNVIDHIKNFEVPYIMVNGSTHADGVIHIVNQDEKGARIAADYLYGLGHRNIFVLAGPQTHRSHYLRLKGFQKSLEEHGAPLLLSSVVLASTSTFAEGYDLMCRNWEHFRKGAYTSLFATNDMIALGAMKFLLEQSVSIPEQVAVIGFDDIDFASMYSPSLTTVRVEKEEMGIQAFTLLDKLIRKENVPARNLELEPKLIVRQSTGLKKMQ